MTTSWPTSASRTAQSLYAAIVNGVGLGVVSLGAGALYAAVGGGAYFAMAAMGGVGGVLAARLARNKRYLASSSSE